MKKNHQTYFLFIILFLCSCSHAKMGNYKKFTAKKPQAAEERIIHDLTFMDSLNITKTFKGYSISEMSLSKSSIIAKLEGQKIVRFSKQSLDTITTFMIPTGKGPGEILNLNTVMPQAGRDFIALYSIEEKKIEIYDLNGNFEEEFISEGYQPHGNMAMVNKSTYYFEAMPGSGYLFYELKRKTKSRGTVVRRFQHHSDDIPMLARYGSIAVYNHSFYFAGNSEPVIRRYDLSGKQVKLVWSRGVIDTYNSKNNYQKPQGIAGGGRFIGYTEDSQFATKDIVVDADYVYSVRDNNGKEGYKYMDVYAVKDGNYIGSFHLRYFPYEIAIDKHYIYMIEKKAGEPVITYLMKYKKPEMNF